jgi:hypothetical protein
MAAVDKSSLERWRSLDAVLVLRVFAEHAKQDLTFVPVKSSATTRWHAIAAGHNVELLLTGPKFWNTRDNVGGGGAIDLVMHLTGVDFKAATRMLSGKQL